MIRQKRRRRRRRLVRSEADRRVDFMIAAHAQGLTKDQAQMLLRFGLAYDGQVIADHYKQRQLELQWRTIGADKGAPEGHQGGTPVQMDKAGNIHKGPKGVAGRNIKQLDRDVAGTSKDRRKDATPPRQPPKSPPGGVKSYAQGAQLRAKLAAEARQEQIDWDRVPEETWQEWTDKRLRGDAIVDAAIEAGYRQGDEPAAEEPEKAAEPTLGFIIADIRYWMGSGKANREAEQKAMDIVGADGLSQFGHKLASADEETKRAVWRVLKEDQEGQLARATARGDEDMAKLEAERAAKKAEEEAEPAELPEKEPEGARRGAPETEPTGKTAEPEATPPAPEAEPKDLGDQRGASFDRLMELKRDQLATLQESLGVKDGQPGQAGVDQINAALDARPGGEVIRALIGVDGSVSGYNDFGLADRNQDAFRAQIADRFTQEELDDAAKWAAGIDHVDARRWLRGTIRTAGASDTGKPGDGPDDRPTIPGQGPEDAGGTFKLTNDQADPLESDEPRRSAGEGQKKLDEDYIYARASAVRNKGEDLKGSARHKLNAWRSLQDAEAEGTAERLTNRNTLEKAEPHTYSDFAHQNPIGALAAHLALKKFPSKPGYGSPQRRARQSEEEKKKDRARYVEAYTNLKAKFGEIGKAHDDPLKAVEAMRTAVSDEIKRLRGGDVRNQYDNTANALVATQRGMGGAWSWARKKTSVLAQMAEFAKAMGERHGELSPADKREKVIEDALDVMENGGLGKITGKTREKVARFNAADAYVKHASREGGRELATKTADATTTHMVDKMKFRGVQFGNSMSDDERQHHASKASEAMMDLADVMGLEDADMSFGGKLGLAFGARGKGTALAHYEPEQEGAAPVINITRKGGVGALAHEWGHGLDNQLSQGVATYGGSKGYMSDNYQNRYELRPKEGQRGRTWSLRKRPPSHADTHELHDLPDSAVRQAYQAVFDAGKAYRTRLNEHLKHMVREKMMGAKKAEYWRSNVEVFARSFEKWVQHELKSNGRENTYLSGLGDDKDRFGLWPNADETKAMAPAFQKLAKAYAASDTRKRLKEAGKYALAVERGLATLERYAEESGKRGGWVTIGSDKTAPEGHKGGARVFIDGNGRIVAGPKALEGRSIKSLDRNVAGTAQDQRKQAAPPQDPKAIAEAAYRGRKNIWAHMREMGIDAKQRKRLAPEVAEHMTRLAAEAKPKPSEARARAMEKRKAADKAEEPKAAETAAQEPTAAPVHKPPPPKTQEEPTPPARQRGRVPTAPPEKYPEHAREWGRAQRGADWHGDQSIGANAWLRPKGLRSLILDRGARVQDMAVLAEQGRLSDGRFWLDMPEKLQAKIKGLAADAYKLDVARAKRLGEDPDKVPKPEDHEEWALGLSKMIQEFAEGEFHDMAAKPVAYRDAAGDRSVVAMQGEEGIVKAYDRKYVDTVAKAYPDAKWHMPWEKSRAMIAKTPDGKVVGGVMPITEGEEGLREEGGKRELIAPNPTRTTLEDLYEPGGDFEVAQSKQRSQRGKPTIDVVGTDWGAGQRWAAHAQKDSSGWRLYAGGSNQYRELELLAGPFDKKADVQKAIEDLGTYATGADGAKRPTFTPKASPKLPEPKPVEPKRPKAKRAAAPSAENLTPTLKKAITGYIGSDQPEDVEGFHEFVKDAYRNHLEDVHGANDDLLQLLGQFGYDTPQKITGLVRRVRNAEDPESPQMPRNFDQLVDMAADRYPRALKHQTGESTTQSPEEALFQRLKAGGLAKIAKPWDDAILEAAGAMLPEARTGGEDDISFDPDELTDWETVDFSLKAATARRQGRILRRLRALR